MCVCVCVCVCVRVICECVCVVCSSGVCVCVVCVSGVCGVRVWCVCVSVCCVCVSVGGVCVSVVCVVCVCVTCVWRVCVVCACGVCERYVCVLGECPSQRPRCTVHPVYQRLRSPSGRPLGPEPGQVQPWGLVVSQENVSWFPHPQPTSTPKLKFPRAGVRQGRLSGLGGSDSVSCSVMSDSL